MIAFDFNYYKPASIKETLDIFKKLDSDKFMPIYYGGGTEIIIMSKNGQLFTKAVIDIKDVSECKIFSDNDNYFIFGSGNTLSQISEKNIFPFLSENIVTIGDHTVRDKITIGGHICSHLNLKEAVLPFLLCDAEVFIASENGEKHININEAFNKILKLNSGEFLVNLKVDKKFFKLPYKAIKKFKQGTTGYPLITFAAIKKDDFIRFAFSGLCDFPFRSSIVEKDLNDDTLTLDKRIDKAIKDLPGTIIENILGSKEYREHVFRSTVKQIIQEME